MLGKRKCRTIFHEIDRETVLKINRRPNRRDLSWPLLQPSSSLNSHIRNSSSSGNLLTRKWHPSSKIDVYKKFFFPKDKFCSSENVLDNSDILCNMTNLDTIESNKVISNNDTRCKVKLLQKKNKISYKTILLDDDSKVIEAKKQKRFSCGKDIFLTSNYDKSKTENIQKVNEYINWSNTIVQEIKSYERQIGLNEPTFNDLLNLIQRKQRPIAYLNDDKFIEFLIKNKDIKNEYYDPEYFNGNFPDDLKHFETVKKYNNRSSDFLQPKKNQDFIELLPKLKIDGTTKKKVSFSLPSSPIIEVVNSKYKNHNKITSQHSLDGQKFSDYRTDKFEPVEGIYRYNNLLSYMYHLTHYFMCFYIYIFFNLRLRLTVIFSIRN